MKKPISVIKTISITSMQMIDLTANDYGTVVLFLRHDPHQSYESDRPLPKLEHVTSVKQAITIIGGDVRGFIKVLFDDYEVKTNSKQVWHWRTKNKFPANMTVLIETLLNARGYAPIFDLLTQIPIDVSEEIELIERLAAQRHGVTP